MSTANLTQEQKLVLLTLINHPSSEGIIRDEFFFELKDKGINAPLPVVKRLCNAGFMRFDPNADRKNGRTIGRFKSTADAYKALDLL